jgi:hypothetical protein
MGRKKVEERTCVNTYAYILIRVMKTEGIIRILAGVLVLTSVVLSRIVHPNWLILAAFVGANLIQSAFTGFCPAEIILRRMGVGSGSGSCGPGGAGGGKGGGCCGGSCS